MQIGAQILSQQAPNSAGQAGLLVRQSTDPGAPEYAALLTPAHTLLVRYRTAFGGIVTQATHASVGALPQYVEIQRRGNQFTAATSSDGRTYTLVPGSTVTMVMPASVWTGLAVSSGVQGSAATASFSGVVVGAPGAAPNTPPPVGVCPGGWTCTDVGNAGPQGSQSLSGSTWTVQGGGGVGIIDSGPADQFHGVWQSLSADGSVSARLVSQTNTNALAKAGVMLRASADAGSPYYAALVTTGNGILVQFRGASNALTLRLSGPTATLPLYLKVTRVGSTFTTFTSTDGATWVQVAGSSITLSLPTTVLAGLAVTSHNFSALNSATFDGVQVGSP
jgi:hypothetical protein